MKNTSNSTKHGRRLLRLLLLLFIVAGFFSGTRQAQAFANPTSTVFINEIHYDNISTDAGEAIEIAGPAGTDLTGWSIVLYNGSNGTAYDTDALSGVILDQQGGYGTIVQTYASNGIQNGSPDGIALVDATATLVQFISYEGVMIGVGGAADGVTSTDIGISQAGTEPLGASLQLTGTGTTYGDFVWTATTANTFGSPNTGQTFGSAGQTDPSGTGAANPDSVNPGDSTLLTVAVTPGANPTSTGLAVTCDLTEIGGAAAQAFFDDGTNGDSAPGDNLFSYQATVDIGTNAGTKSLSCAITDAETRSGNTAVSLTVQGASAAAALVINEVDYDQDGTDAAEFVEIRNNDSVSVDLSAYSVILINGSGGAIYDTIALPAVTLAPGDYFVVCANAATVANCDLDDGPDTNFIQNGSPDAVGLLYNSTLIDAVSYEGNTAGYTEGTGAGFDDPAFNNAGLSRCPDGVDTDQNNADFSFRISTPGTTNACLPVLVINEIDYDQPGTDAAEFVEIRNNDIFSHNLADFTLELVNGNGGGAVVYDTINLSDVALAPGEYFVVCANAATVANCDLDDAPDTNFIQNGAPDAVGLRYQGTLIDAVSYEGDTGAPYTEGSGVDLVDDAVSATQGISRCPDGVDTNQNNLDFVLDIITPGAANNCVVDIPPTVASTNPADGTPDAPIQTNIVVNFSEDVSVSGSWFDITCASSGAHTATVSGGPLSYVLDPDTNFTSGESCTVTIFGANVTDLDGTPDPLAADYTFSFTALDVCVLPFTPIYDIQGNGLAAAITGTVTTQGVVVGDYEGPSPTLRGFYIQDAAGDGDASTSDGIFVFNFDNDNVNLGDIVRVSGSAGEFQDQTQVSSVTSLVTCGTGSVTPVDVTLPFPDATYPERYEGMLVRLPQTLYVTEMFQLGRFGQVVMSADGRLAQPTNVTTPGAAALALQAANDLNRIIFDDDLNDQNPDPIDFARDGMPLSASNTLRGGDTATNTIGVFTYTWAGNSASGNAYRVRPIGALGGSVNFEATNPRPAAPTAVGGTLKVAGMNLLNFFNTFDGLPDTVNNCTNGVSGTAADCRGADTQEEFDRQWPKTVAAILGTDADVIGIVEIENDGYGPDSALQFLVDRLNDATAPGTYAFIDVDAATGQVDALGSDAIKVGLIYRTANVMPVGDTAVLNTTSFINGGDSAPRNRASLAQAFEEIATGGRFIVNVNHLKSKGSACDLPDAGDGQGNCNAVRVNAANELTNWLAGDPTGTGDPDVIIVGDLNAYAMEDPITAILGTGYTNLILSFGGPDAYSYVFDGQWGYLDHALASPSLASQVTGVTEWHINADEPGVLDYNTDFKSAGQISDLYAPDQYRVSDHDPVIVGLNLNAPPVCGGAYPSTSYLWPANHKYVSISVLGVTDPDGDPISILIDSIFQDEAVNAPGSGNTAPDGTGVGTDTAQVRAERMGSGNGRVYHIYFTATDSNGNSCNGEILVTVPRNKKALGKVVDEGPLYDSTLIP